MIRFESDYLEGAHENIINRLVETNMVQTAGYGFDPICGSARDRIRNACESEDMGIYFIGGGTHANLTVISNILRPHQGCLTVTTGHINVHETGAIEATGHKVLTVETEDGKIRAKQIQDAMEAYRNDPSITHVVQPGMVYISQPTETGTMYSKEEMQEISRVCKENKLPLFVDGARLAYALASEYNDLSLADLAKLTDVFYIGGTKCGALFGEAVCFNNKQIEEGYIFNIKQKGAMLAKGRLLGIQFDELFKDNLYVEIAKEPVKDAIRLRKAIEAKGWSMQFDSYTNQQFAIIPDEALEKIKEKFVYSYMEKIDENKSSVRFCTSWASSKENVDKLIDFIGNL